MRRLILLTIIVIFGCTSNHEAPVARQPDITLAVLGQALIEHDPRAYVDSPIHSIAPILSGG
jgi:hypothetical protein